jgi:hypothetical protein
MFLLDSSSGHISVIGNLDYEKKNLYEVTVQVQDLDGLTGNGLLLIEILDVNDAPIILRVSDGDALHLQEKTVAENSLTGSPVGSVVLAADPDGQKKWNKLIYSLVSGAVPSCGAGFDNKLRITAWLILGEREEGPFQYDKAVIGDVLSKISYIDDAEVLLSPSAGNDVKGKTWTAYKDQCSSVSTCGNGCNGKGVNLFCHFYNDGHQMSQCSSITCTRDIAYAFTYLFSDANKEIQLYIASNAGHTVWVNGKAIASKWTGSCYTDNTGEFVKVMLQKGVNRILVKIQQGMRSWGFTVRVDNAVGLKSTVDFTGATTRGLPTSKAFKIHETSGQISVANSNLLNHEKFVKYILKIKVTDNGGLEDLGDILVRTIDINEAPAFAKSEMRYIKENRKFGALIGEPISATDNDASQSLVYWTIGYG